MQPPSDHHSFFFWCSETDPAMKKRTAESLYEMMQPLSDPVSAYTGGIVKCYDFIKYYKHVMVQPLRDHQLGRRAPEWSEKFYSMTDKTHGNPCLTHAKLNSL